ncbi:MAG: RodZ domain-containing protein [Candidatus Margulisiibacteriota bacterium]|jgi:cytoskeletal protein RodZ
MNQNLWNGKNGEEQTGPGAETPGAEQHQPSSSLAEQAQTVGKIIQNTRLKLKLPIEKMSKDTKIRQKYLQAIEDDNFSIIPEQVAAKGFIKICAEYLGLNPQDILKLLKGEEAKAVQTAKENSKPKMQLPEIKLDPEMLKKGGLVLGAVLVILILLFFINQPGSKNDGAEDQTEVPTVSIVETANVVEVVTANPVAVAPGEGSVISKDLGSAQVMPVVEVKKPEVKEGQVKLAVKALKDAWIKVSVDNNNTFHGLISEGETKTWYGKTKVTVRSPEPDLVRIIYNDKDQGQLGKVQKVVEKSFQVEKPR